MSRIARNGTKPKTKKKWKAKSAYMAIWMTRKRAADAGDAHGYIDATARLDAKFPSRGRKPLKVARRAKA